MAFGGGGWSPLDLENLPYDSAEDLDFDFALVDDDGFDDYDDSDSEMNDIASADAADPDPDPDPYGDSTLDAPEDPARDEDGEEHQGQPEQPAVDGGDRMDTGEGGAAEEGAGPGGPANPSATGDADLPDEPNCPVCFDPWTPDGPHRVCCIPCGHVFGRSCLQKWIERSGNNTGKCPLCNAMFNKQKGIINLFAPVVIGTRDIELEETLRGEIRSMSEQMHYEVEARQRTEQMLEELKKHLHYESEARQRTMQNLDELKKQMHYAAEARQRTEQTYEESKKQYEEFKKQHEDFRFEVEKKLAILMARLP